MERPADIGRPFFAYGLFRPGQLAFFQVRELVSNVTDPTQIAGSLLLRDGLPIIDSAGNGCVKGALMTFRLLSKNVEISMDGKGRALDIVFVERLWRSVKYEDIYLKSYESGADCLGAGFARNPISRRALAQWHSL